MDLIHLDDLDPRRSHKSRRRRLLSQHGGGAFFVIALMPKHWITSSQRPGVGQNMTRTLCLAAGETTKAKGARMRWFGFGGNGSIPLRRNTRCATDWPGLGNGWVDAHPANASRIAGDSPFTESWLDAPKDTPARSSPWAFSARWGAPRFSNLFRSTRPLVSLIS